jgi:hypothetical protein
MAKRRALKDTVKDPLVTKAVPDRLSKSSERRIQRTGTNVGKMVFVAAVAAGFICGWLAGRFIRII